MMATLKSTWFLAYLFLICNGWQFAFAASVLDAFDDDINSCLLSSWNSIALSGNVDCKKHGFTELCYGLSSSPPAQFVVCYDTTNLIPVFTAHIVNPVTGSSPNRPTFKPDKGPYKPSSQAADKDYSAKDQDVQFPEFDYSKNLYCARGHLVPNADYGTNANEAAVTFILTNAAPQWQKFNGGNWMIMEKAVRDYSSKSGKKLYVFTGTGGAAKNSNGAVYRLNYRVTAPQYYWILVCDVTIKEMVIFVGTNPVGIKSTAKISGCNNKKHTEELGVMKCYSYKDAKNTYPEFKLPNMDPTNCPTNKMGTFLNPKFS